MTDEYFQIGKSLAELYDLVEIDPWQPPVDQQKLAAEKKMEALQKRILDQLQDGGFLDKPEFDGSENEDPTISKESTLTMFWRLTVPGQRISDILAIVPSVEKTSLTVRNTRLGCWIAFTSKRVANRIETSLNDRGMVTHLSACDITGKLVAE